MRKQFILLSCFLLAVAPLSDPQCIVPPNGAVVKLTSYTALAADTGKLIVMNCSSACTLTLPSTPQSPVWQIWVSSIGSTAAAISPNGLTLDGSSSNVTLSSDLANGIMIMTDNANYFSLRGNIGASVVTAASNFVNGNIIQGAGANKTASDSGIATANVPTAASNAAAANQIWVSGGANKTLAAIDFPDYHDWPAAANEAGTAAGGWDCNGATPAATLRAGTNNKGAFLGPWGASDTCQVHVPIPKDWVTSNNPSLKIVVASTDTTSGHTIIMQAATSCSKGDGTTTDDVAFNAAQSFGTITLNATANQQWDATLSNITMTGCVAGGMLRIQVSRTTDTATNVEIYDMAITIPRRLVVQAN